MTHFESNRKFHRMHSFIVGNQLMFRRIFAIETEYRLLTKVKDDAEATLYPLL
jgi:hypothetical protein